MGSNENGHHGDTSFPLHNFNYHDSINMKVQAQYAPPLNFRDDGNAGPSDQFRAAVCTPQTAQRRQSVIDSAGQFQP
jgi:hypothetical protein